VKALLSTLGTHGDLNPFLAIGRALKRRGHDVTLLVNPAYRRAVERAGLGCRDLGEPWEPRDIASQPKLMDPRTGTAAVLEMIATHADRTFDDTDRAVEAVRPDVMLAHHVCVTLPWVADAHGLPWATAATAPASWPSLEQFSIYPGMPDRDRFPRWTLRAGHALGRFVISRQLDRPLNRLRRARGLPPVRHVLLERMFEGRANLGLWSPAFRPPASDDPPGARVCGFTWMDGAAPDPELAERFDAFIAAGPPPVVFTLGTSAVHVAGGFYDAAAEACRRLGCRGVLLTGNVSGDQPRRADDDQLLELPYLPHGVAFAAAAATVHHGGMGTTAQALRCGRPMVIVPHAHDQFDNAARCRRLGVSITVKRSRARADALAAALQRVLADGPMAGRAGAIGGQLADEDGAEHAADAIESIAADAEAPAT
jgi:UDP:flavonoid glycosyltransferase YjiC (YdhE family)